MIPSVCLVYLYRSVEERLVKFHAAASSRSVTFPFHPLTNSLVRSFVGGAVINLKVQFVSRFTLIDCLSFFLLLLRRLHNNKTSCAHQFGAVENGITVTKLMQIFSRQAAMMDALISHFAGQMRRRKDGTDTVDNVADDGESMIYFSAMSIDILDSIYLNRMFFLCQEKHICELFYSISQNQIQFRTME